MKLLDRRFLIGSPSEEQLQSNLAANPSNFEQILDDHLSHQSYQELAKRVPEGKERLEFEWLINPFLYAQGKIPDEQIFQFAEYLNKSVVWRYSAPHFLDSSAWTLVISPLLDRCPKDRRQELAEILNADGLLRTSFQKNGYTSEITAREWGIVIS
ncbi:MAG: hypothetical protein AAF768_10250 [Pseudomonadota bacterium]